MTKTINRRRFPILLVATLALLAFFCALAQAPAAQAQETWSATLTVGKSSTNVLGFNRAGIANYGSLSDRTFSYDGTNYRIDILDRVTSSPHWLRIRTRDNALTQDTVDDLVLVVNGASFALSRGISSESGRQRTWNNSGLSYAEGDTVSVSLVRKSVPRFTDAEVSTDGRNIKLTFSEDLDHPTSYSSTTRNAFTVTVDGVDNQVSGLNGFEDTVTLTMARLMGGGQAVVVSYDRSDAGSQALEDSDDNKVPSFTRYPVDNKSEVDLTPPALTAATVSTNGNNVTLTFDENVVPAVGVLPSALADAFTVTVDGFDRGAPALPRSPGPRLLSRSRPRFTRARPSPSATTSWPPAPTRSWTTR